MKRPRRITLGDSLKSIKDLSVLYDQGLTESPPGIGGAYPGLHCQLLNDMGDQLLDDWPNPLQNSWNPKGVGKTQLIFSQ
jgi:hypothetical protein